MHGCKFRRTYIDQGLGHDWGVREICSLIPFTPVIDRHSRRSPARLEATEFVIVPSLGAPVGAILVPWYGVHVRSI